MKIIGIDDKTKKRVTCKSCASIIEYVPKDIVNLWSGKDYSGGADGADGFKCPNCKENVIISRW